VKEAVQAKEGAAVVFERQWSNAIERDLM
jgi:hypothetical protein